MIPVQNIYHLLTYAWNQLEEAEQVEVEADPADDLLDLFARVLAGGCTYLLKKGLDRCYVAEEEVTGRLRGKILFNETLRQNHLQYARAHCAFDEFSYDVLHNRILKATLYYLLTRAKLDKQLHNQIKPLYQKMGEVKLVIVTMRDFHQVRLHRNNGHYRLLLHLCQMIWEEVLNREEQGSRLFRNFQRDKRAMAVLFEQFVLRFYQHHFPKYQTSAEQIKWKLRPLSKEAEEHLPKMRTDVTIESKEWKVVLDCKYYEQALKERFGKLRINSNHLYQLMAYLENQKEVQKPLVGILLYPVVEKPFSFEYEVVEMNGLVKVMTVNLSKNWKEIEEELKLVLSNIITHY